MGFIRGSLLVIAGVFLFLSLLIGNIFLILTLSLDYNAIQPKLVSAIKELSENEKINLADEVTKNFGDIKLQCQKNSEFIYEDSSLSYVFNIPCNITSQGPQFVLDYGINNFIEQTYYKDYECDFLNCIENLKDLKTSFFLVSKEAHDYWKGKFYFSLIISFILVFLIFLLIEQKDNFPFVIGAVLIISSLPFMKLNLIFSIISAGPILLFLKILFSKSYGVSLVLSISGFVLLGVGLALKLFRLGFFISKKLEEKEEENVKSEKTMKKRKSEESKK